MLPNVVHTQNVSVESKRPKMDFYLNKAIFNNTL